MRKFMIIAAAYLLVTVPLLSAETNCYTYDRWGEIEKSPDTYRVDKVSGWKELGLAVPLSNPSGIFARDNKLYVCDTGNNRIIELQYNPDRTFTLQRVIGHFNAGGKIKETFDSPEDVFAGSNGDLFICDTNNGRVVKLDRNLNLLQEFLQPDNPTYDKTLAFMPVKVVADVSGRVYVLAKNVNRGFLKYESDGTFTGFYGAGEVHPNVADALWKKLATQKQKKRMESFVPTEYSNASLDKDGFIYAVTRTFDEWDLKSDKAKPVRRLNALGKDILIKNAAWPPIGDLQWGDAAGYNGPSRFTDVTVFDDDSYVVLDDTRGRLFGYNSQGYLLFAFGGKGNINGFFKKTAALDHINRDLLVLDSMACTITVFSPTDFGNMIYEALDEYAAGRYDESAALWSKVMHLNGNYDLAYIGLGKAALRSGQYKSAMEYFKLKWDAKYYSKAFVLYRREWVEHNLGWMAAVLLILLIAHLVIKEMRKIKEEVKRS
jgi:hypothetical protein